MIASISNQQNTWTRTTLNEFCGQRGQSIEPSKTPDSQFELYSVPSFPTGQPEIVSGKEVGSNKQMVTSECVLLCKINPRINRAWVVGHFSHHTKIASTEWIVFPPDKRVEPRFLCYFLQQNAVRDFLASNVSGVGGSLMRVKPSTLRDFPFAYPERDEQSSIVAEIEKQFSRLDEAVANLKRVKANLKRYKAAVLKAAVEGKLTEDWRKQHPDLEPANKLLERILAERRAKWSGRGKYKEPVVLDKSDLPSLAEGWVWVSLEQLSWKSSYGTSIKCSYENVGPTVLRIPNIESGKLDFGDLKFAPKSFEIERGEELAAGDVLIIRTNGSRSLIGRSAVVRQSLPSLSTYASYLIRFRLVQQSEVIGWVSTVWDADFFRQWIEQRAATSAGQHNISMTVLAMLPIPLPPLAEQAQIVAEVERRLSVIEELEATAEANLTRADRLRQSVLARAFSGELTTLQ